MDPIADRASSPHPVDLLVRALVAINAGAAAILLVALLVAGLWQDAAVDFVFYIAVGLALHGAGLIAGVSVYAFRHLQAWASRPVAARLSGFLAGLACAASAVCLAFGLAILVWGGLNVLASDDGSDSDSHSVPLGWTRS